MPKSYKTETAVIHAGQSPEPVTGAVMPPIFTTTTYAQPSPGQHTGFEYSRAQNPTRFAFERCIAALEDGKHAFAFASGLATMGTIMQLLQPNDHVIISHDVYGGSFRLLDKIRRQSQGLQYTAVDLTQLSSLEDSIQPNTRLIWMESPSNPLLQIIDLKKITAIAQAHNILTVCDNTFASPMLQQPLTLGVDIVMHSATKYIGGHSDVTAGVAIVKCNELADKLRFLQMADGAICSPFDSFILLRSLKTLAIRMQRHCENARALAAWLEQHPKIDRVYYPGLTSHPQHDLASTQMKDYGGMISATIKGSTANAIAFLEHCQIFTLAESLGGVESLIEIPSIMTHASIPKNQREKLGIHDTLVRFSVGIEHCDDLKNDIEQALSSAFVSAHSA